jgi:hypothetical protein
MVGSRVTYHLLLYGHTHETLGTAGLRGYVLLKRYFRPANAYRNKQWAGSWTSRWDGACKNSIKNFGGEASYNMRCALFSVVTQRRVVIIYRRFGITYLLGLLGP